MHRCVVLIILLFVFLFCHEKEREEGAEPEYDTYNEKEDTVVLDGTTLLNPRFWALSAAHCNLEADDTYTLRAGTQFVDQGGSVHKIVDVVQSPEWDPETYDSDFALLKVDPPFEYDETTRNVKLPPVGNDGFKVGDLAFVSGWGFTQPTVETASQVLQATDVPVVSPKDCHKYMGKQITENMFCAGYPEGGPDACKGDSGGPLVLNDVLIGVVSWGQGCAQVGKVGVYAKISVKRAWIKEVTRI